MAPHPLSQPISPTQFLQEGFDWTGRTKPGRFAALLFILGGLVSLWRLGPTQVVGWGRGHEALAVIPLIVFAVPATVHVLRRLNDMGWRGWWAWALALPGVRWGLVVLLVVVPSSQRRRQSDSVWRLLGVVLAGMAALVLAGSLLWATVPVPAQGMKPALWPGDLVLARRAPLVLEPGDVIAFRMPADGESRVARIIAMEGDRVAVEGGIPVIYGRPATWADEGLFVEAFARQGPRGLMPVCGNGTVGLGAECRTRQYRETLPGGQSHVVLDAGPRPLDRAGEVAVPEGFLYVLGDNRDTAQDSRRAPAVQGTGLVAVGQVIGRVDMVLASSDSPLSWDPRGWRLGRVGEIVW